MQSAMVIAIFSSLKVSSVKNELKCIPHCLMYIVKLGIGKGPRCPRNDKTPNTRSITVPNQGGKENSKRTLPTNRSHPTTSHNHSPPPPPPYLCSLALLAATPKQAAHGPADALPALHQAGADLLPALGDGVDDGARRPGRIAPVLVLALALGAVDALFREGVADGLEEAVLADLAGDEAVDAILEVVDLLVARNLGLAQGVCEGGE